jgi:hypothetical protein
LDFLIFFFQGKELCFRLRSWQVNTGGTELQSSTILFIPLCASPHKFEAGWAASCAEVILRGCPSCGRDSIIGHGHRRKQAHDEHHDWIDIRRGRCPGCGKTFTFLPLFSLPYTHYSLLTRCQVLRRHFVEHCSWEEAVPTLKDPDRVPDPSTLRRWAHGLDCSQPALSFLRQTLIRVTRWLVPADPADQRAGLGRVVDSLQAAQHVLEMFRRALPDGSSRRRLDRLSNRLTKILSEARKLATPSEWAENGQ